MTDFKFKIGDVITHRASGKKAVVLETRSAGKHDPFTPEGDWYFLSKDFNDRERLPKDEVENVFE